MTSILSASDWKARVDDADWARLAAEVGEFGCALTPALLTADECDAIAGLYDRAGPPRRVGGPFRAAVHPRPGVPRRRLTRGQTQGPS